MELIREAGSVQALADKLGKSHSQISQLKTRARRNEAGDRKTVGTVLAREIEQKLGKPLGWMDTDPRSGLAPVEDEPQAELPLAPKSRQTAWRAAADRLAEHCAKRHVSLDPEMFLLFVDAAMDELHQDVSEAAAAEMVKRWLPVLSRGRGVGHASA